MCRCRENRGKLGGHLKTAKLAVAGTKPRPRCLPPPPRPRARKRAKPSAIRPSHSEDEHDHSANPKPTAKKLKIAQNSARKRVLPALPADGEVVKAEA
ncbi:hypothetical protein DL93DRAFT_2171438 [Clavulina sp. PMI_390]|nr:hypothetical protein DL93DRAFT_2171438 [Clavulina sp. PMI_390]